MASFDQGLTIAPVASRPGRWSEHAKLYQQVKQIGLMDQWCGYFAATISLNLVLLPGGCSYISGLSVTPNRTASPQGLG